MLKSFCLHRKKNVFCFIVLSRDESDVNWSLQSILHSEIGFRFAIQMLLLHQKFQKICCFSAAAEFDDSKNEGGGFSVIANSFVAMWRHFIGCDEKSNKIKLHVEQQCGSTTFIAYLCIQTCPKCCLFSVRLSKWFLMCVCVHLCATVKCRLNRIEMELNTQKIGCASLRVSV